MSVATPRKAPAKKPARKSAKQQAKKPAHRRRTQAPRSRQLVVRAGVAMTAGVIWAALLVGAMALSTAVVALVVLPVGLVAAVSAKRVDRRRKAPSWQRYVAFFGPIEAGVFLVVASGQGASLGLALAAAVTAFDAGAFVMGSGRSALGGPVGVLCGMASVGVVAVFVAAIMNPPFSGLRPWLVFGIVALLAPAGVKLCEVAVSGARLPALRRLDSMVLAAPAWVICLAVLTGH